MAAGPGLSSVSVLARPRAWHIVGAFLTACWMGSRPMSSKATWPQSQPVPFKRADLSRGSKWMEGPEAPTSHLASGSTSPTWAAQLRDGRGRPAEGRGQAEPRANGMGSTAQAPKVAAQCTPTMSQRPPRNFRRRQADSGSSSDPDLDPEPSPDSGLTGRASERASGASGSRGRARVWATSRRAETRPAPKREAQDFSGSSGDSAGRLSDPPRAPAHADFLPLSGSPRQRGLALKGSSDSDSEDEPDPRGQATSCSSEGPDAASSEEEAQDAWETQQMRKALRVPGGGPASGLCHVPTSPAGKRVSDWAGSFPPVSLESIKKQLSSRLASLEDVHRCHQREYECRRQDADSARKAVAALQEAPDPAPTYAFYRSLKDYLAVLLDCLSEKTAAIEALESALRALLRDRAASRLKRRQEELRSEAAHLQQLAARSTDCAPDAPGLCEEAAARRSQGSRPQPREGPSSEEEPEEEADLRDRQGDISRRGHRVFEDVGEDFSDSRKILLRFEQWRERFPDSYRDAYASLCLPKLLGPFIRLQMLDWNPLVLTAGGSPSSALRSVPCPLRAGRWSPLAAPEMGLLSSSAAPCSSQAHLSGPDLTAAPTVFCPCFPAAPSPHARPQFPLLGLHPGGCPGPPPLLPLGIWLSSSPSSFLLVATRTSPPPGSLPHALFIGGPPSCLLSRAGFVRTPAQCPRAREDRCPTLAS